MKKITNLINFILSFFHFFIFIRTFADDKYLK